MGDLVRIRVRATGFVYGYRSLFDDGSHATAIVPPDTMGDLVAIGANGFRVVWDQAVLMNGGANDIDHRDGALPVASRVEVDSDFTADYPPYRPSADIDFVDLKEADDEDEDEDEEPEPQDYAPFTPGTRVRRKFFRDMATVVHPKDTEEPICIRYDDHRGVFTGFTPSELEIVQPTIDDFKPGTRVRNIKIDAIGTVVPTPDDLRPISVVYDGSIFAQTGVNPDDLQAIDEA